MELNNLPQSSCVYYLTLVSGTRKEIEMGAHNFYGTLSLYLWKRYFLDQYLKFNKDW